MATAARAIRHRLTAVVAAGIPFNVAQGAVFPYWILYLHDDLRYSTALAGLVIGTEGVAALVGALLGGALQDHVGARRTAQLGALAECVGYASVVAARSPLLVAGCFAILGLSSMRYPARSAAALAALPRDLSATRFFSWDFMAANAGFGLGIAVGAVVVSIGDPASIRLLFVALSGASVVLAATYGLLPNRRPPLHERDRASYRSAARQAMLWHVAVFGLLLSLASYASFDAGIPAFIGIFLHASPRVIAFGFLTNPILIVLGQHFATRAVVRMRWRRAFLVGSAIFASAWLVLLGAIWWRTRIEIAALLVVFAAMFSVAEMLVSPLRTQLTAAVAPEHLRGRYYGANHFARGVAGLLGPSFAGAMIGDGLGFVWLVFVALFGWGAAAVVHRIFRLAPEEIAYRS